MASFTTFSDAAKAAAPQLEPTLEAALRKYDVHEDIITGFRCNRIKSQYLSCMPATIEDLRRKYWVMTHMWQLAKMRQPSRPMYADLDEKTWSNFLEELLNRENFNFRREIEGSGEMVGPDWNHCLEYEFQFRKEALRLIRDQGVSIQQALWAAYADPQHRMKRWITHLTVANSRSQSSKALMDEMALLRKAVVALRSQRSRSPRGQRSQEQPLALQDKPATKGKGSSAHDSKGAHLFDEFQQKHKNALWHERANANPGICWRSQRKHGKDAAKCNREHVCIGCARPGVPYNDCLCLEAKF